MSRWNQSIAIQFDRSTIPREHLDDQSIVGLCSVCFAMVPTALMDAHVAAAHGDGRG